MNNWNIGDLVRLKSGGPQMTVNFVNHELRTVTCVWFDEHNNDKELRVAADALEGVGPKK